MCLMIHYDLSYSGSVSIFKGDCSFRIYKSYCSWKLVHLSNFIRFSCSRSLFLSPFQVTVVNFPGNRQVISTLHHLRLAVVFLLTIIFNSKHTHKLLSSPRTYFCNPRGHSKCRPQYDVHDGHTAITVSVLLTITWICGLEGISVEVRGTRFEGWRVPVLQP